MILSCSLVSSSFYLDQMTMENLLNQSFEIIPANFHRILAKINDEEEKTAFKNERSVRFYIHIGERTSAVMTGEDPSKALEWYGSPHRMGTIEISPLTKNKSMLSVKYDEFKGARKFQIQTMTQITYSIIKEVAGIEKANAWKSNQKNKRMDEIEFYSRGFTALDKMILVMLKKDPKITIRRLGQNVGLSVRASKEHLDALKKAGLKDIDSISEN
jgi:hypothetical protein